MLYTYLLINSRMAAIAILAFCCLQVSAQLNESDTALAQIRLGVTGVKQNGNVDLFILRGRLEWVARLSPRITFKSQNNSLYQQFSGFKADNDIISRNYLYYQPTAKIYPFALAFMQSNFRLKIDSRYFAGAGATLQLIRNRGQSVKVASSLVYEQTRFSVASFNEALYDGQQLISIWRPTFFVSGIHHLAHDQIHFRYMAYWQYGLDRVQNQRVQYEFGVELRVWKGFAVNVLYVFNFEQVVATNVLTTDSILTFGLTYQYLKNNTYL